MVLDQQSGCGALSVFGLLVVGWSSPTCGWVVHFGTEVGVTCQSNKWVGVAYTF